MLSQESLKLTNYVMCFCAFSWICFLKKKTLLEKFKTGGILRVFKDFSTFIQYY